MSASGGQPHLSYTSAPNATARPGVPLPLKFVALPELRSVIGFERVLALSLLSLSLAPRLLSSALLSSKGLQLK
ncbi:hypothetical protein E2C01_051281 [Portunus trituberculatus]|uniref:Uncharacterized protein n=1 Tax=Portunus trituberculatus TaxID=210409 RepID=A0A5B7GLD1_PORTR|nr:hypothetical protein [Portunus trituberculatus]